MATNEGFVCDSQIDGRDSNQNVDITRDKKLDVVYTLDEALDLAGTGKYNYALLGILCFTLLAMGIEMFGISMIVIGCSCDFELGLQQKSLLISTSFVGTMIMAYPWGYISDTKGRKKTLLMAMWVSFLVSIASAFSPNWIVLAILKLISTSFCSCAHSVTFALMGESCSPRIRANFMIVLGSVLNIGFAVYVVISHFTLELPEFHIGTITILPWRVLAVILSLPLCISAAALSMFHESPKFLINAGYDSQALNVLNNMWIRNGGAPGRYPVKSLRLNEMTQAVNVDDVSLMQSLWDQTVPLFRPPLLWHTIKLFYLSISIYCINNGFYVWVPFFVDTFFTKLGTGEAEEHLAHGVCDLIVDRPINNTIEFITTQCSATIETRTVYSGVTEGLIFTSINLLVVKAASRKKLVMIAVLVISCLSSVGTVTIGDRMTSLVLLFGVLLNGLCIGIVFSYFVDLYPTSYRGMAACLGMMVGRGAALAGINLLGAYVVTHCSAAFYVSSAYIFSSIVVTFFLPSDKPKKKANDQEAVQ